MRFADDGNADFKHWFCWEKSFRGNDFEKEYPCIQADLFALHEWMKERGGYGVIAVKQSSYGIMCTLPGSEPELGGINASIKVTVTIDEDHAAVIAEFKLTFCD